MEKEAQDGESVVEEGSLTDLSIDEQFTVFGFHAGRLYWPGTAYAMVVS